MLTKKDATHKAECLMCGRVSYVDSILCARCYRKLARANILICLTFSEEIQSKFMCLSAIKLNSDANTLRFAIGAIRHGNRIYMRVLRIIHETNKSLYKEIVESYHAIARETTR